MKKWQDNFPKVPGYWWFYGWPVYWGNDRPPKLHLVEVAEITNRMIYGTGSFFLYPSEAKGKWQKAVLPELPTLP